MISEEILNDIVKEFNKNGPCPHDNHYDIGFGHFVRCDDCGRDVPKEFLGRARMISAYHDELSIVLQKVIEEYKNKI